MTPTPEEVLARACSVTRYEGHETYEHRNCRWCGAGGYVNHPKIKTDFEHRPDCPIVALAASEEQLHALQLSHRIRGENIEMLERELMLFREATLR